MTRSTREGPVMFSVLSDRTTFHSWRNGPAGMLSRPGRPRSAAREVEELLARGRGEIRLRDEPKRRGRVIRHPRLDGLLRGTRATEVLHQARHRVIALDVRRLRVQAVDRAA